MSRDREREFSRKALVHVDHVERRGNELRDLINTLRKFRKLCEKEGIIRDLKKYAAYEKPSETKRRKLQKSIRRSQPLPDRPKKDKKDKKRDGLRHPAEDQLSM